ncbi:Prostaglandin reductase-3 [Lamellibrachia satsuma]|nr:Prostaglandin reductase-3 [Lamellibrachia satsuma]
MPTPGPSDVLVKNRFLGINASDINYTSARYDPSVKVPFECGFEAVGEVVSTGKQCQCSQVGQAVAYMYPGAFSEYLVVPEAFVMPLPAVKAEFLPLIVSGMTAAIALDKVGDIQEGETVLVTAAAGGYWAAGSKYKHTCTCSGCGGGVQWAREKGCHVIGTCSSDKKVQFLKNIGCHRPINYTTEKLRDVLKAEYPNGVDVVYETVGGDLFDICVKSLAKHGRLLVLGFISGYDSASGIPALPTVGLPARLLRKSASVRGFFLHHYTKYFHTYMSRLVKLTQEGRLHSLVDYGVGYPYGSFHGLEAVHSAVEYQYTKKSVGKVTVDLMPTASRTSHL